MVRRHSTMKAATAIHCKIIRSLHEQNRPEDSGARDGARRAGHLPRRVPGFLDPVAAGNRRSARHLDGDEQQVAPAALRGQRHGRVAPRLPAVVRHRAEGRGGVRSQALRLHQRRAHAQHLPPVRRDGGPHPVDPAAAGPLQDLRAAGGRRRHQRLEVHDRHPDRRGLRYTVEGLLALWYGERAMAFIRDNGTTVALVLVALIAIGFVIYLLRSRRADKLQ